jgi:hypothetical protein
MAQTLSAREARARARRRERVKADVRDLVFRLCSGIGLLLVLPWALSYVAAPAECSQPGQCIAEAVTQTLIPMLGRMFAGVAAGMLVAVALCRTVPWLKRREL